MRGNKTQRKDEVDVILPDMDRVEDGEDPLLTGLLHVSLVLVQEAPDKMDQWSMGSLKMKFCGKMKMLDQNQISYPTEVPSKSVFLCA